MKHSVLATLSLFACLTQGSALPYDLGNDTNVGIVGGTTAPDGACPYMISLRYSYGHHCGGSILNSRWVLTAAHCTDNSDAMQLTVVVGTNRLDSGGTAYRIERIINHPGWDSHKIINDISLVRVSQDIAFNAKVRPINLPSADTPGGVQVLLSGWGFNSYPGNVMNDLQLLRTRTLSHQECVERHSGNHIPPTILCVFSRSGEGACSGDSGSPIVVNNEVVGIASWVIPCAVGYPDSFTRVWSFMSWIRSNMN